MVLRIICPVCENRMQINISDGIVECLVCGYQPMQEWSKITPEAPRPQLNPLIRKGAVEAKGDSILCPQCGSDDMTPVLGQNTLKCQTCGALFPIKTERTTLPESLRDVLLQRKSRPNLEWRVSERVLNCQNCGAHVTVPADQMASGCPFCQSKHVVMSDIGQTFEPPSSLIPFAIEPQKAQELVEEKLKKGWHGIAQLFRDRVVRYSSKPVYLPFWRFEVTVDVTWRYPNIASASGTERVTLSTPPIYAALNNREDIVHLLPYRLDGLVDFRPEYLARIQTQIQQVDITQAAPLAIREATQEAEAKVRRKRPIMMDSTTHDGVIRSMLKLSSHAAAITYNLVLFPIFVVHLYEKDGDVRRALVNAQTGTVRLESNTL